MLSTRHRVLTALLAGGAAATVFAVPGAADAGGTKDRAYDAPPSQKKDAAPRSQEDGAAPLNQKRAPLQQCPGGAQEGKYSADPSYYPFELGKSGTSFEFTYDTYSIPDKFDILYQGKVIASTGWRGSASANDNNHALQGTGDGSMTVNVPKGRSTQIEVRVTTDINGTAWAFQVACPN